MRQILGAVPTLHLAMVGTARIGQTSQIFIAICWGVCATIDLDTGPISAAPALSLSSLILSSSIH